MSSNEFTEKLLSSKIINMYVSGAFFGIIIYYIFNINFYTPLEMLFGIMIVTIGVKGLTHVIIALLIALYSLEAQKEQYEKNEQSSRVESLLNDLALQQAQLKSYDKEE